MEQAQQNTAQELTAQAIPQQAVEDACFHSLGLIGRNCEYLEQHLARVGADAQSLQAVSDISAATAKLERTINELLSALEFLRAGQPPKLYPLDLCELLQQVAAQADMVPASSFPGMPSGLGVKYLASSSRTVFWVRHSSPLK